MKVIAPELAFARTVRAFTTTRVGGASCGKFTGLNLATHVGDLVASVSENRRLVENTQNLPATPRWLNQVHGTRIVNAHEIRRSDIPNADGSYTDKAGVVCAIMSADCLPIVIADSFGQEVATLHAGWKGLLEGVVPAAIDRFRASAAHLSAWIGPGISVDAYAVKRNFRDWFVSKNEAYEPAFRQEFGVWHADLYLLAQTQLRDLGVATVSRYQGCTYGEPTQFFSYRRDGVTGRMATLAWIEEP
ncbi:MAG: YfiH family protein [Gammaproteobacteria bacterium]